MNEAGVLVAMDRLEIATTMLSTTAALQWVEAVVKRTGDYVGMAADGERLCVHLPDGRGLQRHSCRYNLRY